MRDIFLKKQFEDAHNETIEILFDIEGYEPIEVKPLGQYGYRINTNHLYKVITNKNIYFLEDGKLVTNPKSIL